MQFINRSHRFFALAAVLILLGSHGVADSQSDSVAGDTMGMLVTPEWLYQHLNDSDLVILDCTVYMEPDSGGGMRAVSGRARFEEGHIPSAGFADLTHDLCDVDSPLGFAMPTPEQFCAAMGKLGVGDDSKVVLYDAYNSVWSARVWWMLRWIGFDRAALLDGGLKAWSAEGRELSTKPADHAAKKLTFNLRPETIADRDEVFEAIRDDAVHLIDAMPAPHFRGEMAMYGRPGHIPSADNISALVLIDDSGRYKSDGELVTMFTANSNDRYITYCGAGVAASSTAFVLTRLGFKDVAVYMGSLQEWAADPGNPLVVDEN
ncbi:sulfurtransferase [bacterium]|nr:sulfurtransferase [bacterium]